jgi:hypothetical protein|tara:strand:- start:1545 stop:1775 length:231 start_codon:yes stop_codon:yes gene_type:complete
MVIFMDVQIISNIAEGMFERSDIIELILLGLLNSSKYSISRCLANQDQVRAKAVQFSFWRAFATYTISSRGGLYVR